MIRSASPIEVLSWILSFVFLVLTSLTFLDAYLNHVKRSEFNHRLESLSLRLAQNPVVGGFNPDGSPCDTNCAIETHIEESPTVIEFYWGEALPATYKTVAPGQFNKRPTTAPYCPKNQNPVRFTSLNTAECALKGQFWP